MFKVLRLAWAIWFLFLFIVVFIILYFPFRILLSRKKWYLQAHILRKVWAFCILYPAALWPSVIFEEKLDKRKTYIFCSNHFSYLDIVLTNFLIPNYFNFMAKDALGRIPVFGIFFRTIDISVNRTNMRESHQAFKEADKRIKEGTSVLIFPEGGIHKDVPPMAHFKAGAFKLAIENQIPIVPITLLDNWKRMPGGGVDNGLLPGRMRMVVHREVSTVGLNLNDQNQLKAKVFSIIEEEFKKHNPIVNA
jgi:1-acyl-sn-glycerol-3-phosphate acyltransferase